MTADAIGLPADPALRRALGDLTGGAEAFTQRRVERIARISVAFGSTVVGVQSFLNALGSVQEHAQWHLALMLIAFLPLAIMILGCIVGVLARAASGAFAVAFVLVLLAWPAATAGIAAEVSEEPWIWYLLNIATTAAVLAFRIPLQVLWALLVPLLYGAVRLYQIDFRSDQIVLVVLDVVFALILAGVVLTLGWMLRSVAVGIDRTRAQAVASYAEAAAAAAAEEERVAVAALMHDSVLAALIAAERAETAREQALAASMAREALTRLANADRDVEEGPDAPVPPASIADEIVAAAADFGVTLDVVREIDDDAPGVPGRVARALALAATQAVANAVQHAGAAGLAVRLCGRPDGIELVVSDTGDGFDPDAVPVDRLGIRASIVARVAAVAGHTTIDSGAGGTVVTISWEQPR
ncbi:ATP-binding protein [Microbacterium sp. MC2]